MKLRKNPEYSQVWDSRFFNVFKVDKKTEMRIVRKVHNELKEAEAFSYKGMAPGRSVSRRSARICLRLVLARAPRGPAPAAGVPAFRAVGDSFAGEAERLRGDVRDRLHDDVRGQRGAVRRRQAAVVAVVDDEDHLAARGGAGARPATAWRARPATTTCCRPGHSGRVSASENDFVGPKL